MKVLRLAVVIALSAVVVAPAAAFTGPPYPWKTARGDEHLGRALVSVDGARDGRAYAVGIDYTTNVAGIGGNAVVERWDGERWRTVAGVPGAELTSVSVRGSSEVWVTGYVNRVSGPIKVWRGNSDGDGWTRVTSRGLPRHLSALVVATDSHVWLLGSVDPAFKTSGALVASYRREPRPHWAVRRLLAGAFFGGFARTDRDVYAVGGTSQYAGHGHPLVAHWDGDRWTTSVARNMRGSFGDIAATGRSEQHFKYPQVDVFTSVAAMRGDYWASINWRSSSQFVNFMRYDDGVWTHERGRRLQPPTFFRASPLMTLAAIPGRHTLMAVGHAPTDYGTPRSEYPIRARRPR